MYTPKREASNIVAIKSKDEVDNSARKADNSNREFITVICPLTHCYVDLQNKDVENKEGKKNGTIHDQNANNTLPIRNYVHAKDIETLKHIETMLLMQRYHYKIVSENDQEIPQSQTADKNP